MEQRSAAMALLNSMSMPSLAVLTVWPPFPATVGSMSRACANETCSPQTERRRTLKPCDTTRRQCTIAAMKSLLSAV
jgi:hypothetical protein